MVELDAIYPLTPLQHGMLYHSLAAPRSGVDIEQLVFDLPEPIDPPAFRAAWELLAARHAVLRTSFRWSGVTEPQQQVAHTIALPWTLLDWTEANITEHKAQLATLLTADRTLGFELNQVPLLRLTLIRLAAAHWTLAWTFHHAILDGRSFAPRIEEVFALYAASPRAPAAALVSPPSFRDHVAWLRGQDPAASELFWRRTLADFGAPTPLPGERKRLPAAALPSGNCARRLSSDTTATLRHFAQANALGVGTLVQAAWALVLSRHSGRRDVVFGVTRAGRASARPASASASAIGLFINTLPLRIDVDPDLPLTAWLADIRARWNTLRPHEHTPLASVQAWSAIAAGQPLFETLVVFENHQLEEKLRGLGGAWAARSFTLHEQTNFPLTLAVNDGTRLALTLQFDPARIEDATAERLLLHVELLLEAMPTHGHRRVRELPLMTPAEETALLSHCDAQAAHYPPDATLVSWFEGQVQATPDRIAVVCGEDDARVELTYRALNARADLLARTLTQRGVGPEIKVVLFLERSPALVVGILGILKAGGAYVPIDPASPPDRIAFMLHDSGATVLLTQNSLLARTADFNAPVICVDEADMENAVGRASCARPEDPHGQNARATRATHLAYVLYTSGSTGQPKGTLVTHHNVVRLFRSTERLFDFNANDVWTLFHSSAFDFSVWELWGALLYGGRLVIVPHLTSRSPDAFRALLARERVTILNQTPSAFHPLIATDAAAPRSDALALRIIIFGGEALELSRLTPWFARHGDQRPRLVNMYGITETTVHVTYRALTAADVASASVIGAPLPDLRLYLLDPDLRPVPPGMPGELFVGGDGLARGYFNQPDLTARRFIPDPFHAGERLYRTGDQARWLPHHDLEYLGRIDQQVKIRGFRIELGEIEAALLAHPALRDAVVIARDEPDHERRLVAYLVRTNDDVAPLDLRAFLQTRLPDYMIPAAFVTLPSLPLTENGKLDRRALPAPDPARPELATAYAAPRTPTERTLAAAWEHVLRLKQVGVHDRFFDLGGNSLLLVQLLARLGEAFPLQIQMTHLFQFPTIRLLAAHLAETPGPARFRAARARAQRQLAALQRNAPSTASHSAS